MNSMGAFPAIAVVSLLLCSAAGSSAASEIIGTTEFAQGEVAVFRTAAEAGHLRRSDPVHHADVVETGQQSYAIFEFDNDSRIAVRERTRARLEREAAGTGHTHRIRLVRGGIRGTAVRKDPYDVMVIDSPAGVVIVDEGEITTRWCNEDCGAEAADAVQPVGKVQMATSPVSAKRDLGGGKGKGRVLAPGDYIYERERIETGNAGQAILVFRDDMRMTLQGGSLVDINAYRYFPQQPDQNEVHIQLRQGRVRVKSGSVAQATPNQFVVETPVNRVRVRGTGFDLHCVGTCVDASEVATAPQDDEPPSGLYTEVWEGAIVQESEAGAFPLAAGQASYVRNGRTTPVRLPRLPPRIIRNQAPRPDSIAVGMETLFELNAARGAMPGLYVHVHSGRAQVETATGRQLEVTRGRTGYFDPAGSAPVTSGSIPGFMATDGSCN